MLSFVKSVVANQFSDHPVQFKHRVDGTKALMEAILKKCIPDLAEGSLFLVNPLLLLGHTQTAYTALKQFENIDRVHYKRRLLTMESDKKWYEVEGEKLAYDRWGGELTFAIDYVVPELATDPDHSRFKPDLQIYDLPPRTEYLNPANEHELLANEDKPLVIALHGLSGGSYELYIRAFLSEITGPNYNFDAMVLNARGCANHTLTSPQLFNGLWTNDLRYLINEHIRTNWPNKRVYLIGFSLGGAIMANYLGQELEDVWSGIRGAAVMGTPWDFPDSLVNLRELVIGYNVYLPKMCQNLVRLMNTHGMALLVDPTMQKTMENLKDKEPKRLKQFDDFFTLRLFGFNLADEYYRHALPNQRLMKVRVPTVIVSSLDDPITGHRTLPRAEVALNPYVLLVTTSIGGHLGWFRLNGSRWYPKPVSQLFAELDKNWTLDKLTVSQDTLPIDVAKVWKFDRLAYKY